MAIASGIHLTRLAKAANCLAIAVAVSLPWSTSATSIFLVLWLIALIPTLDWDALWGELMTAAGGLPVLLFLLGALGMLWADIAWHDRLGGLNGFVRLLTIPLLMAQFSRSDGGRRVLIGFLASCVVLLIASFVLILWPQLHPRPATLEGVPVKSYIVQGLEFAMCAAVVLEIARLKAAARQWRHAAVFAGLGLAFLADVFFVNTGRTALVIIPALVVVYGIWRSGWKGLVGASLAAAVLASIVWFASPFVRDKVTAIYTETLRYERNNDKSSSGVRIEFWKKSIRFIAAAPVFGHGTGSIRAQFEQAEVGRGASAIGSTNPHNQTFGIGIQLGLAGMGLLWAMWISQLLRFRGAGLVAWTGLVIVASNIVGSLFNSFVFDFTEGWIYVFGAGVVLGTGRRLPDAGAKAAQGS